MSKSAIDSILKKYNAAVQDPETAGTIDRVILDSPNLNYVFGGGFAKGRIHEFFGPESGGKSVLSWYIASHIQRQSEQNKVLILDFEHTFDKGYARTVGLDLSPEKLIFVRPLNGEEGFTVAQDLVATGEMGLVIIDSLAAVASVRQIDSAYGKAQMGSGAGLIAESLKKLNPYLSRSGTSMIIVNQVRDDIGGFSPVPGMVAEKTPGGRAPKFYASWRGRISRTKDITNKGIVVGNGIKVKNVKSKIGYPKRACELVLYYDQGFDTFDEYVDFVCKEEFGLATVRGAWIYATESSPLSSIEEGKWQGRAKLKETLKTNPAALEQCRNTIVERFNSTLEMDREIEQDPDAVVLDESEGWG